MSREEALRLAVTMYPDGTPAEHVAVAEYLLGPAVAPAPVYPPSSPSTWPPPWQVTCGVGFVATDTTQSYVTINSSEPLIRLVSDATGIRPDLLRGRPDDDGTAGVPARVR